MRTNVIVGGLVAVLGALMSAPLLADKSAGANKIRNTAEQNQHSAEPQSLAHSVKSQRRERVRYTFPPSKR
jgi:hypothetical protein